MIISKTLHWFQRAYRMGLTNRNIFILIILSFLGTVTEIFGIGIFLPVFQFIRLEGDINALVADSILWEYIAYAFDFFNIKPSLTILLFLSFLFFIFRQLVTYIRLIYGESVKQNISKEQRDCIFSKYIKADASYHDNTPVGDLVNVVTTEVRGAVIGVMAPLELFVFFVMLSGYLFMLSLLSLEMTILSFIVLLLSSRVPNIWIKKTALAGRKIVSANKLLSEFLVGRLKSPRLVRLSGTEKAEESEFNRLTQDQCNHILYAAILRARSDVFMEPIVIGLSLFFLYLSYTVLHLQVEVIGLYLVIALRLLPIVKGIITQWQTVQRSLGSIEVLEGRLKSMQDNIEDNSGDKHIDRLEGSLLIENVSYCYSGGKNNVLKNITIKFGRNRFSAVVGPSGSGKSTLIDLLPRLRNPDTGSIIINGVDIKEYTLKSLREMISYVPQSPQIFNGTVKNHILYGKGDATHDQISMALSLSDSEDFVNQLPQGINTVLGEDAVRLSGGQRQRLDLARALIKEAPILILDEPTSNLDAESEEMFKRVLARINNKTNTTIIVVAHRLASIADADNIIVLKKGEIEAYGTHVELLSKGGWYSKAWKMQITNNG